ncbi:MAG TPA: ECF-type sigma factor [Vicinamibacterales bacterium]|nr:ECF-type sigma factor [Vicinamibacterales bacterium]
MGSSPDITALLVRWKDGDESALDSLVPLVYAELRGLARSYLRRERRGHTLQATALVNELFIRLAKDQPQHWTDRAHFFGIAARAMRQILVAHARHHHALKRGGGAEQVPLDEQTLPAAEGPDLTALDAALTALAACDPQQAQIVELRFFGGYTIKETAVLVRRSPATVSREWETARMWLFRELSRSTA